MDKVLDPPGSISPDDTSLIQAAIVEVSDSGGGTVIVPASEYRVASAIALRSNVSLVGTRSVSRIHCTGRDLQVFCGYGVSNVALRGLVISSTAKSSASAEENAAAAMTAIVFQFRGGEDCDDGYLQMIDLAVEDCEIYGFKVRGMRWSADRGSARRFRRVRVVNSHIHDIPSMQNVRPAPPPWADLGLDGLLDVDKTAIKSLQLCLPYDTPAAQYETCIDGLGDSIKYTARGIQLNGCDGGYVAGNVIEKVGVPDDPNSAVNQKAMLLTGSQSVMIVGNHIRRCGAGIAIAGDIPIQGMVIESNVIDLREAVPVDPKCQLQDLPADAVCCEIPAGPYSSGVGISLVSNASAIVVGNFLKACRISGNCTDTVIADNVIDFAGTVGTTSGIVSGVWLGEGVIPAQGVTVANNRIMGIASSDKPAFAIKVSAGKDFLITGNHISGADFGIHLEPWDASVTSVSEVTVVGNRIQDVVAYVHAKNVTEIEIAQNHGVGGTGANAGIQIDGATTSNIWIHHNRIGKPITQAALKVSAGRGILLEDNVFDPPIIAFSAAGVPLWPDTANTARRNTWLGGEPSPTEEQSWWAFGADYQIRFITTSGTPSVLGGTVFRVKNSSDTLGISGFSDGYVGQTIHIFAVTPANLLAGNIQLAGGIVSYGMSPGDMFTFVQFAPDQWQEVARKIA